LIHESQATSINGVTGKGVGIVLMRIQAVSICLVLICWHAIGAQPAGPPKPPRPSPASSEAAVKSADVAGTAAAQSAADTPALATEIQLEAPRPDQLFRPESEATFRERMRAEANQKHATAEFPKDAEVVPAGSSRLLPPRTATYIPYIVCYRPLYFEDKNTERYGWHLPLLQPLVSTGKFYVDTLLLPYNMGVQPPWACECNAGYYLPGDPVPYMAYLPPWSWTGAAMELGAIGGGIALFH
jgi:hypothetical protein